MSVILSIETSTNICSVALLRGLEVLGSQTLTTGKSHSEYLTVIIENLLSQTNVEKSELDAIAFSEGPGSYTGLRIGSSVAKGLCYALDVRLVVVSTLEAMAKAMSSPWEDELMFCPMIDARRMEVYAGVFKNGKTMMEVKPVVVDVDSFDEYLDKGKIVFFGNGAMKCTELIQHENAYFHEGFVMDAVSVGQLAYEKFQKGVFEDIAYYEPNYLKEFYSPPSKKKLL